MLRSTPTACLHNSLFLAQRPLQQQLSTRCPHVACATPAVDRPGASPFSCVIKAESKLASEQRSSNFARSCPVPWHRLRCLQLLLALFRRLETLGHNFFSWRRHLEPTERYGTIREEWTSFIERPPHPSCWNVPVETCEVSFLFR
ncbi:hypothetical protein TRVL_08934 [Trypanosoma vivax]|nr:hypothetical protein TRVL_08934 [Trypanosoma vivax]